MQVKKKEVRSIGEVRAVDDTGIFEGYIVVWDAIDDYNTRFARGSFKKTIQERGSKLKVLYDHDELIGSSIEIREDDHGVFVRGQLNLDVAKAKETYSFLKNGTLEGLSFGFRTVKQAFVDGAMEIREVMLYEYGPVMFPAGSESVVTDVRSQDFNESLEETKLRRESYAISSALEETLTDIWWDGGSTAENVIGKLDQALSDYHASYLDFASRWVALFWSNDSQRSSPFANSLETAFNEYLTQENRTIEDIALKTSLTIDELRSLKRGALIENRDRLGELDDSIVAEHRNKRNKAVETLCSELRGLLTVSEKRRISALLGPADEQSEPLSYSEEVESLTNYFKNIGDK